MKATLILLFMSVLALLGTLQCSYGLYKLHLVTQSNLMVTQNEYEVMRQVNVELLKEIELRQDITSVIIDASRSYKLDPKLLTLVLKSESNFRPNPNHRLPNVHGVGGINIKANPKTLHNPQSYVGNIYASAEILANYVESSDSLTLALTRYKGLSPLGYRQARDILEEYK